MNKGHCSFPVVLLAAFIQMTWTPVIARAQSADPLTLPSETGNFVHITGNARALEVDAHHATVDQILFALGSIDIQYHSSQALDETLDGKYIGNDRQVLARVLDGYNYAIRHVDTKLEVLLFGKRADHAVPAVTLIQMRSRPSD